MVCRQRSQVSKGHLPKPSSTVICQEERPAKAKEGNTARLLRPEPLGCYLEMPPHPSSRWRGGPQQCTIWVLGVRDPPEVPEVYDKENKVGKAQQREKKQHEKERRV